jgi:hypothetical protein
VLRFRPSGLPPPVNVSGSCFGCGRFESCLDHLNVVLMTEMRSCLQSLQASSGTVSFLRTFPNSPFTVNHSYDALIQGCINTGLRVVLGLWFCTVAPPNICGPSVWNLLHVISPAPGILRWLLDFGEPG